MQIAHIAVWTTRLEELRNFYVTYFGGESSDKYVNPGKGVESYFVRFGHSAAVALISSLQPIMNIQVFVILHSMPAVLQPSMS